MRWNGKDRRSEEDRLAHLEVKVDRLSDSVEGLVVAWNTAGGVVRLVKWVSGGVVGVAVIWKLFKESL